MSEAQEIIQRVRTKAEKLKVDIMAINVVKQLGKSYERKYGVGYRYEAETEFYINYDAYGDNLIVDYKGKRVLDTQTGNIIGAILEQDWVDKLIALDKMATISKTTKRSIEEEAEIQAAEQKWQDHMPDGLIKESKPEPQYHGQVTIKVEHGLMGTEKTFNINEYDDKTRKEVEDFVRDAVWTKEVKP